MNVFKARLLSVFVLVCLLAALPVSHVRAAPKTYRVKPTGLTSGSCGGSWSSACGLRYALSLAIAGDRIWVAAGTYKPTTGSKRAVSFVLENGVAVYGGFAGTETALEQRNPVANVTILSGDIGTVGDYNDNSYHVVIGSGTNNTAILDGFTIADGNSDWADGESGRGDGGGMLNLDGSPTLVNLVFSNNRTGSYGAGAGLENTGSPALTNVTFSGNSGGGGSGGGMHTTLGSPVLTNVTFSGNTSANGGALSHTGSATLINVTFAGNSAQNYGGAIYNIGTGLTLRNVTLFNNTATTLYGGGLYNYEGAPVLVNTILWGNTASTSASAQVYNDAGGAASISYSVVQGGYASGTNIITGDPKLDALDNYGGFTQSIRLLRGSSAINAGNDAAEICPTADQRGVTRPQSTHCDIGAYEFEPGTLYVKEGTGGIDGASWASAYSDLQSALAVDISGDKIWVAAGTYKPTIAPVPAETDRAKSFTLENGVEVYGGFAGTETALEQRNPVASVTTLSGDIGTEGNNSDNSYHVVVGSGTDTTAILDGFTITGGNANSLTTAPHWHGGGMLILDGSPTLGNIVFNNNRSDSRGGALYNTSGSPALTNVTFSSNSSVSGGGMHNGGGDPALTNVTFSNNSVSASGRGGGMYNDYGSPTLTDVAFNSNYTGASGNGGGMYNFYGSPTLLDVTFDGNLTGASGKGGGMYRGGGSPTLTNVIFSGNTALQGIGGGLYSETTSTPPMSLTDVTISGNTAANGGGVFNNAANAVFTNVTFSSNTATVYGGGMNTSGSDPTLTNVTFSGNTAPGGGGIYIHSGNPTLTNVTFKENTATNNIGGAIANYSGIPIVRNTIAWGNTPSLVPIYGYDTGSLTISDSVVQGGCPAESTCTNIITTDPLLGILDDYGGFTQTIPIHEGSSAIDAGSDCTPADQRGVIRPQHGDNNGIATCDIGAYEFEFIPSVGMYDDTDPLWDYSPEWTAIPGSGAHDGTIQRTSTNGATATFDFRAPGFFTYYYRMGPNRGTFEIWVDGVLLKTVNAYSATTVWQKKYTSPAYTGDDAHTIMIKNTSPDGTYIDVDAMEITLAPAPSGPGIYDDSEAMWVYSPGWTASTPSGPYNSTIHRSDTPGSTATFVFQAPAFFTLYYRKGANRGSFTVWVDGVRITTVNAYSASTVWQKKYTSPAYTDDKAHTVVIKDTSLDGTYIDVDAMEITLAPAPSGPGTYDDSEAMWVYSPGWTADTLSGPYNNTIHSTSTKGSTATFVFQAPAQFAFYYRKDTDRGSFEIWVDGVKIATINAYRTSTLWQKIYTSPAYTDDKVHTVVIRNISPNGTYIDVDAIQIE